MPGVCKGARNSDFHTTEHDFWPGEYSKYYTHVCDLNHDGTFSPGEVVAGLPSGNSFVVQGDLIDGLQFSVQCRQKQGVAAVMGETLEMKEGRDPQMIIRFRSPQKNNNGDTVAVEHIDLIAGEVKGRAAKFQADGVTPNPAYGQDVNTAAG